MDGGSHVLILFFVCSYCALYASALNPAEKSVEDFSDLPILTSISPNAVNNSSNVINNSSKISGSVSSISNSSNTTSDSSASNTLSNSSNDKFPNNATFTKNIDNKNSSDETNSIIDTFRTSNVSEESLKNATVKTDNSSSFNTNGLNGNIVKEAEPVLDSNLNDTRVIKEGNGSNNSSVVINSHNTNGSISHSDSSNFYSHINNNSSRPSSDEDKIEIDKPRGDMDPFDTLENENIVPVIAEDTQGNLTTTSAIPIMDRSFMYNTMSWLDVFMLEQRGLLWVIFNTIFMVTWILIGGFSLYRLLGLPSCSPYISRTYYLVIHLLIFTAATFEFVQLIHFSYGSHEGLPLFLTLLLTHTPTPCLAAALILTVYCVFVTAQFPIFFSYLPPVIYVSITIAFTFVLSFVGDIFVGGFRSSVALIVIRALLLVLCLIFPLTFIIQYRHISSVAVRMRRELRGELKALAIPIDPVKENQDPKFHLMKMLLTWSRITLFGCVFGVLMCLCSFCLSLFFTVSMVPLWAFWVLHTSIFVTQIVVVFSITFGATYTLYNNRENMFRRYILPSLTNANSTRSFIKRGNFIYQRVSVAGPTVAVPPTILENEEQHIFLPNNNLVADTSTSPFRPKVNLKRSATFNCASPYYGFQRSPVGTPFTPNLYPVLSDHILPYSQSYLHTSYMRHGINNSPYGRAYRPSIQHSNSFSHNPNKGTEIVNYDYRYPLKSFHAKDRFVDLDNIVKGQQKQNANFSYTEKVPSCSTPSAAGMVGIIEPLEVAYAPINVIPVLETSDLEGQDRNGVHSVPRNYSLNSPDQPNFIGSNSTSKSSYRGPPEKPARKTEPILVKGVLKDNSYIKGISSIAETFPEQPHSYSLRTADMSPVNTYNMYRNKSPIHTSLNPGLSSCLESTNTSTPLPISKANFTPVSPSISPISSQCQGIISPYDQKVSPNRSSLSSLSNPYQENTPHNSPQGYPLRTSGDFPCTFPQGTSRTSQNSSSINSYHNPIRGTLSRTNGICMTVLKDDEEEPEAHPLLEIRDDVDLSLSTDETQMSVDSSPAPKRHSLRRNHSTAGDFSAQEKVSDTDDKGMPGDFPQTVNGFKHPWYGTWGGRRKSKRKNSSSDQENVPSLALRRLSASKSSLSSIYEKLKPKRKGVHNREPSLDSYPASETNETSSISHEEEEVVEEEEEEEFLPRLDEDLDLASDILKSSTVLADFYSLDRSYLKKRKREKLGGHEENVEGEGEGDVKFGNEVATLEMNGINGAEDEDITRYKVKDKFFDISYT